MNKALVSSLVIGLSMSMLSACGGNSETSSQSHLSSEGEACDATRDNTTGSNGGAKAGVGEKFAAADWTQNQSPLSNDGSTGNGQLQSSKVNCGGKVTETPTPTPTRAPRATCAVKSAPTGKVLQGYWENWDGAANGVHPGMGWIPITQVPPAYNVIMAAFPVILPDGTVKWENGMDVGVKVPTPEEMCQTKANGHWILMSIGGATAAVDLSSSATVDRFIATIVPILKTNNFDGIDIDLESGLIAGPSYSQLSTSQANLVRLIDGVLAQMPPNFMLTMAPETAYVTGGQIAYGGPWGAYLPIIGRYRDNGRLSWLNMQYYNGSMYGCGGYSYAAGTVQGFVEQTKCINDGFIAGGAFFSLPYNKQVPGLPAQIGAGGGYMSPSLVSQAYSQVYGVKGLMTWSINWDGSKGYTFMNSKPF